MKPDIHPQIRAFWEKKGIIENDQTLSGPFYFWFWVIYPNGHYESDSTTIFVAHTILCRDDFFPSKDDLEKVSVEFSSVKTPDDLGIIKYYLNGEIYDEATALRMIKLVAFW